MPPRQTGATGSVLISCACGQQLAAPPQLFGKRVKCPACGQSLQVPSAVDATFVSPPHHSPTRRDGDGSADQPASTAQRASAFVSSLSESTGLSQNNLIVLALILFIVGLMVSFAIAYEAIGLLFLVALLVFWILLPAYLGKHLGAQRSIGATVGFVLGLLLGWIGFVIVLIYPYQGSRKCPYCAELVKPDARVCKHCGHDLPDVPSGE